MTDTDDDKPNIPVPPPLVYVAWFLAGLAIDARFPAAFLPAGVQYAVGGLLVVVSFPIVVLAVRQFRRAGTKFDVRKPATALVTDGLYRYSRNPGYVAATILYVGAAIMVDSAWILGFVIAVIHWMNRRVIAREEAHLERRFGDAYRGYKATVRRWL